MCDTWRGPSSGTNPPSQVEWAGGICSDFSKLGQIPAFSGERDYYWSTGLGWSWQPGAVCDLAFKWNTSSINHQLSSLSHSRDRDSQIGLYSSNKDNSGLALPSVWEICRLLSSLMFPNISRYLPHTDRNLLGIQDSEIWIWNIRAWWICALWFFCLIQKLLFYADVLLF